MSVATKPPILYSSHFKVMVILSIFTHYTQRGKVQNFGRKTYGKKPLGKPRCRWEDNIKLYLKQIRYGLDSSGSEAGSCEHCNEPSGYIKAASSLGS